MLKEKNKEILKVNEVCEIILSTGVEIIARVRSICGDEVYLSGVVCKKGDGDYVNYPSDAKTTSDRLFYKGHFVCVAEVDEDVKCVYEQFMENIVT